MEIAIFSGGGIDGLGLVECVCGWVCGCDRGVCR
jgi:hypothetical protein